MTIQSVVLLFAKRLHGRRLLAWIFLLIVNPALAALAPTDLLEPEKAFRISVQPLDNEAVEVRFRISAGYYMYRDRFKFETVDGQLLADAELPPGVWKKDDFFGETQTYRREVRIRVPVSPQDVERGRVDLKVTSQGCADIGVCYTPLEQIVPVRLTGGGAAGPSAAWRDVQLPSPPGWLQALIAALALAIVALTLQRVPATQRWGTAARAARWPYPALAFAIGALVTLAATPMLGEQPVMFAWGALLVIAAVWLRAIDPLPQQASGAERLAKGLGVLALASGAILIVFALGARGLMGPAAAPDGPSAPGAPAFEGVADLEALQTRLATASKPTLLDFYADWCVTCKEMERFTFSDPAVRTRMLRMQLLQADVTHNSDADKALLKHFRVFGPPAILFFDESGNEMRDLRVIGFQSAARFRAVLDEAMTRYAATGGPR
jgi:thiol:disulfide interchange protein